MTPRDFVYWLQGYFEIESLVSNNPDEPAITGKQAKMIKDHLGYVFNRIQLEENKSVPISSFPTTLLDLEKLRDGGPKLC